MTRENRAWTVAATTDELRRSRNVLVDSEHGDIAVFWNGGQPAALANICIHRKRELVRGNIFQGRLVCPGHQWAFDLTTGFCAERERTQPVFDVRIIGSEVVVDTSAPVNGVTVEPRTAPTAGISDGDTPA
jgi:nitrite reductase (NADH) small subunit